MAEANSGHYKSVNDVFWEKFITQNFYRLRNRPKLTNKTIL